MLQAKLILHTGDIGLDSITSRRKSKRKYFPYVSTIARTITEQLEGFPQSQEPFV